MGCVFTCKTGTWNHKDEDIINSNETGSVSCYSINNDYVKVHRSMLQNGTNESAILSNQVLYSVYVDENFDDVRLERKT